ncbi:alpha-glucuronidase [Dyadobacter chenwenxiniae]|uniref:Xylan alpha-1,2-glucuronidase n=1 Tax=Dyadobacter chenwenxiniae TaxID=2906456 RepID=A0A9X1TNG9_9BACT|nr:alpha-glucuronidase family glycosyl hydrolase [Dyadobacter chenwenxiniae]MCF0064543.1 alpha-glucuronidase [Dyadobacter chenwenxiniae]UON84399.1 alpha-glucuronidase [Dyadobacter chenwenxiniae]
MIGSKLIAADPLASEGDDGYRLWLKYEAVTNAPVKTEYLRYTTFIGRSDKGEITQSASRELQMGLKNLLGKTVQETSSSAGRSGGILFRIEPGAAAAQPAEGYQVQLSGGNIVIVSRSEQGILYGTFALLRHLQMQRPIKNLSIASTPKVRYRMLNHWDNPDGTIERGYAGASLWKWYELPERVDPRYEDYARANASLGINGTVLNNVNASARFMSQEYIEKVAAIANVLRKYGIKTYLSVYFAAPKTLGGLATSDPLDPQVRAWWKEKVAQIYKEIPDFGGFLVKANSEGEPGPQDYGRTHADGANMLAEAFKAYDGIVVWRAFVYKADPNADRFKAAYEEFVPLDGKFDPKVIVQVKNGPIDFQPREPFSPLFGNMPKTPLGIEFQITQEYLGFATHAVYEAPIFKECLDSDTYVNGEGSTVAKVVDGSLHCYTRTLMAGVANTGNSQNWTGHPLAQANWYAFGRLSWDHELSSEQILQEWVALTLTRSEKASGHIAALMLRSREIYVNYNTPLGLSRPWMGVHFAPEPWQNKGSRPDWTAIYYHRADSSGIGFDRTASGSNALAQYKPQVQQQWNNPDRTPLPYLLWFHHVRWDQKLSTGRSLWQELCTRFYTGADSVLWMQQQWDLAKTSLDPMVFTDVAERLKVQRREAIWWRDAWVLYLQSLARQPIPAGFEPPKRTLEEVKQSVHVYLIR